MKTLFASLAAGIMLIGVPAIMAVSAPAEAQMRDTKAVVDQGLVDGLIGEAIDGLLYPVSSNISADLRRAMADINIRRKDLYRERADETGVTPEQYARVIGEKQIAKARQEGWYYMDASGMWKRR